MSLVKRFWDLFHPGGGATAASIDQSKTAMLSNGGQIAFSSSGGITKGGHEFEPLSLDRPTACDACSRTALGDGLVTCLHCRSTCHAQCAAAGHLGVACHRYASANEGGDEQDNYVTAKEILLDRAYTLSSLDIRSIGRVGVRLLTPPTPIAAATPGGGGGVGSNFYAAWTPQKLTAHLFLLSERLPGQEFRLISGSGVVPGHGHQHLQTQALRFRGSLRVHVNLLRPVHSDKPAGTFFLPRGHACLLHDLAGDSGTDELVWQLLAKLRIRDPAHKFGLYLHIVRGDSTVEVRRLAPHEKPLEILLSWTTLPPAEMRAAFERRRFVLQESDASTVDWDAFSIPELQNFLQILSLEEGQHERNIRLKFDGLRASLTERFMELGRLQGLSEESEA